MCAGVIGDRVFPGQLPTVSDGMLIDGFPDTDETGHSDTLNICRNNGGAMILMGYNHMVLAYRPPDDRFGPVAFKGWRGASAFAHKLVSDICGRYDDVADGAPSWVDVAGDPDRDRIGGITATNDDYNQLHRRYNEHFLISDDGEVMVGD